VDAAIAIGWAEFQNDLPEKLAALAVMLPPGTPLLGTLIGGNSIPVLRAALVEADRDRGSVAPRAHPRIDPAAFAELLQQAGFVTPVVDVDRISVAYRSLGRLVTDLRDLGATNILSQRPRTSPGKAWRARLERAFQARADTEGRIIERFDLVNFTSWTAPR